MKKIGIVGHITPNGNFFGITEPYMKFFSHFGQVILLTPYDDEIREDLDLLVLPGGPDVDPFRYLQDGEKIKWKHVGDPCMVREHFDREMLPQYIERRVPIIGICRGHQTLAVHFGGSLNQHMWHETSPGTERYKCVHDIAINADIAETIPHLPTIRFAVNSLHHQTVNRMPPNGHILAKYVTNEPKHGKHPGRMVLGDIEAITYWPNYPAHTVQFHPEEIYDEFSTTLVRHLLSLSDEPELIEQNQNYEKVQA